MPDFRYRAKEGPEKIVEGVVEAPSEEKALEKIASMGYVPVFISASETEASKEIVTHSSRFQGRAFLLLFSRHLSRLLKSGISVMRAIDILAEGEKDERGRSILKGLESDIRRGKTLSQSMEAYPEFFSNTYIAIVRAGEAGGGLEEALSRMAFYLKKEEDMRSKIRRALAYPLFLMASGIASVFFILTFMVPRLSRIYHDMGHELPWPTRVVVQVSSFFQNYWMFIIGLLIFLYLLAVYSAKKNSSSRFLDGARLHFPFFGTLSLKTEFARFLRSLELGLSNGLSFLSALKVAIPAIQNQLLRESLEGCFNEVQKGGSFGQALKKVPYFSKLSANLVSIGEESGRLTETLSEIAETHENEADEAVSYLTTLLEPVMILFIGGIIGFIVMAMLLPIFEINSIF